MSERILFILVYNVCPNEVILNRSNKQSIQPVRQTTKLSISWALNVTIINPNELCDFEWFRSNKNYGLVNILSVLY